MLKVKFDSHEFGELYVPKNPNRITPYLPEAAPCLGYLSAYRHENIPSSVTCSAAVSEQPRSEYTRDDHVAVTTDNEMKLDDFSEGLVKMTHDTVLSERLPPTALNVMAPALTSYGRYLDKASDREYESFITWFENHKDGWMHKRNGRWLYRKGVQKIVSYKYKKDFFPFIEEKLESTAPKILKKFVDRHREYTDPLMELPEIWTFLGDVFKYSKKEDKDDFPLNQIQTDHKDILRLLHQKRRN